MCEDRKDKGCGQCAGAVIRSLVLLNFRDILLPESRE